MKVFAILGIVAVMCACVVACVDDPTSSDTTMSETDSATE